jgi:hypothetical protein
MGKTNVEVEVVGEHRVQAGRSVTALVRIGEPDAKARDAWVEVALRKHTWVTSRSETGVSTTRNTDRWALGRQSLTAGGSLTAGEHRVELPIPPDAPPSVRGEVVWSIRATVERARSRDVSTEALVTVLGDSSLPAASTGAQSPRELETPPDSPSSGLDRREVRMLEAFEREPGVEMSPKWIRRLASALGPDEQVLALAQHELAFTDSRILRGAGLGRSWRVDAMPYDRVARVKSEYHPGSVDFGHVSISSPHGDELFFSSRSPERAAEIAVMVRERSNRLPQEAPERSEHWETVASADQGQPVGSAPERSRTKVKLDRERLWTILHPGQLLIAAAVGFVVLIPVNAVVELSNGVGVSGTVGAVEFAVVAIVVIAIYQWRMLRDDRRSAEIEELRARADSSADREA